MPIESSFFLLNQTQNKMEKTKLNFKEEDEQKRKFKKLSEKFFHYIEYDNTTNNLQSDTCLNFNFHSFFFSNNESFMKNSFKNSLKRRLYKLNAIFCRDSLLKFIEKTKIKNHKELISQILHVNFLFQNEPEEKTSEIFDLLKNNKQKNYLSKTYKSAIDGLEGYEEEFLSGMEKNDLKNYASIDCQIMDKKSTCEYMEIFNLHNNQREYENNTLLAYNSILNSSTNIEDRKLNVKKVILTFKLVMSQTEIHLLNTNTFLAKLKLHFLDAFNKKCEDPNAIENYSELINNLQMFINLLVEATYSFCCFDYFPLFLKNQNLITKENIKQFTITHIFNDEKLFKLLYNINKKINCFIENALTKKYELISHWKIEDFCVSKKFLLNVETVELLQANHKILETKSNITEDPIIIEIDSPNRHIIQLENEQSTRKNVDADSFLSMNDGKNSDESSYNQYKIMKQTLILTKKNYNNLGNKEQTNPIIFGSSINKLKKISDYQSPIHKLKTIIETAADIMCNIKRFYEKNGFEFDGIIESDEIMCIFIYICSKAQIPFLYSQCTLIESFLSQNHSNSISGYYLVTLKACLLCIAEENFILNFNKEV